jgi:asparagine N-glycosylation enzyme membrane subunit Stt3
MNIIVIVLLLGFLFLGTYIRVQNMPNLIDGTTGEYIPLALDPYYFLRVAETMVETGGNLPAVDTMHYQVLNAGWHQELLPKIVVNIYKISKVFSPEVSLRFINVLSPVIFFILGLIVFFFLIYFLTKSRWIAILSAGLLTIIPPYLYRSMAGFSDHEAIGMLGFFLAMLVYVIAMNYLDKKKSLNTKLKNLF